MTIRLNEKDVQGDYHYAETLVDIIIDIYRVYMDVFPEMQKIIQTSCNLLNRIIRMKKISIFFANVFKDMAPFKHRLLGGDESLFRDDELTIEIFATPNFINKMWMDQKSTHDVKCNLFRLFQLMYNHLEASQQGVRRYVNQSRLPF